jgi:hypothetical protein
MRTLRFPCLALAVLLAVPARPEAGEPNAPAVVIRVRSLQAVASGARLLAKVAGDKDAARQFHDFLKQKLGPRGLDGVDTRRPLGLYVPDFGEKESSTTVVAVVPVTDQNAFLKTLEGFGVKTEKEGDHYRATLGELPLPVFIRFAHHYAYATPMDAAAVAKDRLIAPATLFPPKQKASISLSVRLDRIPEKYRRQMLHGLRQAMAEPDTKDDKETPAEREFRQRLGQAATRMLTAVIRDGKELTAEFDLDRKEKELRAELILTPKAHTKLAEGLADLEQASSKFPGLLSGDAAMNGLIHFTLSGKMRDALHAILKEGARQARQAVKGPKQKDQVEKLFIALGPALDTGHLDAAFSLRGPGAAGRYTLVAGARLKETGKTRQRVADLLKGLPEAGEAEVKLGEDQAATVSIRRLDLKKELDAETRKLFGKGPLYVATRPDAFFLALGEDALETLKTALAVPAGPSAPIRFEVSLRHLASFLAKDAGQRAQAEKVFAKGEEGRIRFTVEGGEALRLRFQMDLSTLRLIAALASSGEESPAPSEKK